MIHGTILVDNPTASANIARELCGNPSKAGVGFIDALVSGVQAGALTVMCGGNKTHFKRAEPVINCYAR